MSVFVGSRLALVTPSTQNMIYYFIFPSVHSGDWQLMVLFSRNDYPHGTKVRR